MATQHFIPADPDSMTQAIAATEPGDELVFSANKYYFRKPLSIKNDRKYFIHGNMIYATSDFDGEAFIIVEDDNVEYCVIANNIFAPSSKNLTDIQVSGKNFTGVIQDNHINPMKV